MQPPRPFRGYDKDMFTFLPTSNRDASGESPRKRKLSAYDRQIPMPAPSRSGRSGPRSYTGDFRDKELRNSIPASPHKESSHLRDYPRKSRSWDRKNYEESRRSNKRDRHESIPEYTGYSSPRREAPHFRDYPRKNQSCDQKNYEESFRSNKRDRHESSSEYAGYSSPHRESSYYRDYPRKNRSCDQDYEESCHSNNRDRNETRSEYTGYSSFRGQLQSLNHKDSSPSSVGKTHKSSKWPASMTEDLNRFERHEVNEPKAKYQNASHFQEFRNSGPQKSDQMEVLATSSHDQSPKTVEKTLNLHQVLKTGASVVDIHERDFQTYKASKWSPLMTEANHLLSHESNAHVAWKDNGSDLQGFRNSGPQKPEHMNFRSSSSYDLAFKNLREPQSLQQSFLIPQACSVGFDEKGCQTQKASKWSSSTAEHFDRHESRESNREQPVSHFQEFQNCGPQKLAQINAVAPSSHEQTSEETGGSQSLKQSFLNPGAFVMDFDAKCCNEETHKVESSSNAKESGQASSYTGFDNTKMPGENVGTSECDLQSETNKLLQNALRLLSAASGIVSDNSSGKIQSQDEVKLMKLLLDSGIQNLKHSIVEATTSKNTEATPSSDKFGLNGEKGSVNVDDQCYENKASTFTEKLWDGTLQLSSSVSVSAVAFFKSGEKMQDFSWSGSVAVKGKVRLEAFEKYVQDLPRSRTRGLMVISFCCKEGSSGSDDWLKGMKEVARKYKDGKKVGFAQLSNGVDLYICPHSDAVITILAKHGFFKGMAAVKDKTDPLIGCVVWRKTPSSKTTEANTPQPSDPSLRSSAEQIPEQNSIMANENREPISLSSVIGGASEGEDKPPGFETDLEMDKSNLQPPTVVPENSGASSSSDSDEDDDDLPEYDFGAVVSQTLGNQISDIGANDSGFAAEKLRENNLPRPISTQMRSESSIISSELPDFHIQGLVSQSLGHPSESHSLSLPIEPQKQIRESKSSLKPLVNHFQEPDPQNRGHMHELQNSSLTVQKQKQPENNAAISNSSTLFDNDDDDIPEWCPPVFTNSGPEVARGARPSFSSSHSEVPTSGFAISASSGNLPPLPPNPPPPPPQLELRNNYYPQNRGAGPSFASIHSKVPTSGFADFASSGHLPPLPPTPPPAHLQFRKEDYHSSPHLPPSLASKPFADDFMHKGPAFPPEFARNSAAGPQFDPKGMEKPVYRPAWRGPRP